MATLKSIMTENKVIYFGDVRSSELSTDKKLCREIQKILTKLGYYFYKVDGIFGEITKTALQDFIETENFKRDYILDGVIAYFLIERGKFGKQALGEDFDSDSGVDTFKNAVINACFQHGLPLKTQMAYVLATVQHETNATYKPIREAYWLSEAYRKKHFNYYPYYGRGYVQLTHDYNYEKYSKLLEMDFIVEPDKVMEPKIALFILVHGMATGLYTGKRLGSYVNAKDTDFVSARYVVNGRDKRKHIADLAERWLTKLLDDENIASDEAISSITATTRGLAPQATEPESVTREFKRLF